MGNYMSKYFFAVLSAVALLAACEPEIHKAYAPGYEELIYIEKKGKKLYGWGMVYAVDLPCEYDRIVTYDDNSDNSSDYLQAYKGNTSWLFSVYGEPLGGGAEMVGRPLFDHMKGYGIPGAFARVTTTNGVYGIFHLPPDYYEFGPYEDFFPGTDGFMFKQNGKWGISTYGKLTIREYSYTGEVNFKQNPKVLIEPQFDRVLQIRKIFGDHLNGEVLWYGCINGQWQAYNKLGLQAAIPGRDLDKALKLTPTSGKIERQHVLGMDWRIITQRKGTDEASVAIFQSETGYKHNGT